MNLRKHQADFDRAISGIVAGSGVKTIVAHVTPGGGKSTLPIQAGRLIPEFADRLAWICPRASLQDQGERNFIDFRFRQMFHHELIIRQSTNEANPCRGTNGWISTYQALAVDNFKTALRDFELHRYILVLDEFHHLAADGEWTEPIRELYGRAAYRVLMTGTLSRGDQKKIAFLDYQPDPFGDEGSFIPTFVADPERSLIKYTRRDALADRAIIPLEFHFADGVAEWVKESGVQRRDKLSTSRGDASQALYTALKTEYAQELLAAGVDHWRLKSCSKTGNGSLLVVAASIESAKEYTALLKRQGLHAEIATSDDTPEAVKQIKALKGGKLKILVTVAMAYEGLDVPSISHIICLTNVRSMPWIEQMVARANRIDPLTGPYETQKGYIFTPADRMFVELARKIEQDQCEAVAKQKQQGRSPAPEGNGAGAGDQRPGITPLSSKLIAGQGDLFGFEARESRSSVAARNREMERGILSMIKTQREIETDLLNQIEEHIRKYSFANRYNPKRINGEVYQEMGKARREMTVCELERCLAHVRSRYPLTHIRGTGHARVPTKAQAIAVQWR